VQQAFDEPTLHMDIDRTRVQSVGLQARDVAQNVLVSLSSSFQTAPAFWLDPKMASATTWPCKLRSTAWTPFRR